MTGYKIVSLNSKHPVFPSWPAFHHVFDLPKQVIRLLILLCEFFVSL